MQGGLDMSIRIVNTPVNVRLSGGFHASVKRLGNVAREKCATQARLVDGDTASQLRFQGLAVRVCVTNITDEANKSVYEAVNDRALGKILCERVYDDLNDEDLAAIMAACLAGSLSEEQGKAQPGSPG